MAFKVMPKYMFNELINVRGFTSLNGPMYSGYICHLYLTSLEYDTYNLNMDVTKTEFKQQILNNFGDVQYIPELFNVDDPFEFLQGKGVLITLFTY